jgi:predicted RNA binding protein YcfA (HicA-like mRNA interferase family)
MIEPMNGKQIIKLLLAHGFVELRVTGSHHILGKGQRKVTVPVHGTADVKTGTFKSIEKQSGVKLK